MTASYVFWLLAALVVAGTFIAFLLNDIANLNADREFEQRRYAASLEYLNKILKDIDDTATMLLDEEIEAWKEITETLSFEDKPYDYDTEGL